MEDAHNVLKYVSSNYTHMGPSGTNTAGQTTKLINQVLCGLGFVAIAEATQLALASGSRRRGKNSEGSEGRAGRQCVASGIHAALRYQDVVDYRRTGRIDNMVKDLDGVADLARMTNTAMPLTAVCAEIHRMLTAAGLGGEDQAALMEFFKGPDKDQFQYVHPLKRMNTAIVMAKPRRKRPRIRLAGTALASRGGSRRSRNSLAGAKQ